VSGLATGLVSELVPGAQERGKSFDGGLLQFLTEEVRVGRGELYHLRRHAVFAHVIELISTIVTRRVYGARIAVKKGTQIGFSTLTLGAASWLPACHRLTSIYWLPTDKFAYRFDETRTQPMMRSSPFLSARAKGNPDHKGLTGFGGEAYRYTLGLETIANALSIPADALFYDEVDVIPPDNKEWSENRVDASELALEVCFCQGLIPGGGIDRLYDEGCGFRWLVKCPSCGKDDQILEDLFPACIQKVQGEWARVCVRCGHPYDVQKDGRWVAERPGRLGENDYSYQIPSLIVPQVKLERVMSQYERALKRPSKMPKFESAYLARVNIGSLQPITDAVLDKCEGDYRCRLAQSGRPRYAGVDTGDAVHLVVVERTESGRPMLVWFEEIDSDEAELVLQERRRQLGIVALVCDSKPLRTLARALAYASPGTTWLQDFGSEDADIQSEEAEHFGKKHLRVVVPRTESLDNTVDVFCAVDDADRILLPANDGSAVEQFRTQLKMLQKEQTEDARGNKVIRYRRSVPNHYGLALNSAFIAMFLAGANAASAGHPRIVTASPRRSRRLLEGFGL